MSLMSLMQLFNTYNAGINSFFTNLEFHEVDALFQALKDCRGLIFFCGVGKSALVAEKMAVTMTATGTRAVYISAVAAMHGDIGLVTDKDLFIALSKSGETEEILNLLPYVRQKGAKIASITSNAKSALARAADLKVTLPLEKELCPFNLAPTLSSTAQMIVGDTLAIGLMQHRCFSLDEYAMNHPAGTIGKRLTVKVRDLMLQGSQVPKSAPHEKLSDILEELSNKRAGCVLIVDEHEMLLGIFTDGDLRRALQNHGAIVLGLTIDSLMTLSSRFIGPEALAWEALKLMQENPKSPITVLPVVDTNRRVIGLIKVHDILQAGV
jgi:arabinose-5-phosphate isomerase